MSLYKLKLIKCLKKKKKKKKKTISIKAHPQKALQMCATGFTSSNCMAYSSHIRNKK